MAPERQSSSTEAATETSSWSTFSTSAIVVIFVWLTTYLLVKAFGPQEAVQYGDRLIDLASPVSGAAALLVALSLYARNKLAPFNFDEDDESRLAPVPWSAIWVIVSGTVVVGLGVGFSMAVRAAGMAQ